jgi:hypothetical protein
MQRRKGTEEFEAMQRKRFNNLVEFYILESLPLCAFALNQFSQAGAVNKNDIAAAPRRNKRCPTFAN